MDEIYKATDLTIDNMPENILTNINIGGETLLFFRMGDMMNVYNSNKEKAFSLLPSPMKPIQVSGLEIIILPKEEMQIQGENRFSQEYKYSIDKLGKTWFVSYRRLENA